MAKKGGKKKPDKMEMEADQHEALGSAPEAAARGPTGSSAAAEAPAEQEAAPSLEQQLAQARQTAQEAHSNYLYAVAELQNARRRFQKELAERQQFANEQLIRSLLPILEDFERAVQASRQSGEVENLRLGVEMILKQCAEVLSRFGVSPISPASGAVFDPHRHEVVERVVDDSVQEGTILEVVRPGYELHGRTLRPAQVKAAAKQPEAEV